jgi:hypothetical protein
MRKHTRRKHYATGHLLLGQQVDAIVMPVHISLAAIEMGSGCISNRHTLAAFLNVAGVCAARMVGTAPQTRAAIDAAKYALVEADKRFQRLGRWGFDSQQMLTIRRAITLADALMRRANSAILSYAVNYVGSLNDRTPETLGTLLEPIAEAA